MVERIADANHWGNLTTENFRGGPLRQLKTGFHETQTGWKQGSRSPIRFKPTENTCHRMDFAGQMKPAQLT
ncbi:hypothetical protein RISK_001676 [Rhodopirellula islandica]|uniref:Uncharacterized protein n=1 Tax=Rhodopirellula islandica TaxID=595434 RepID=A0A0J1BIW4_RHOIS|nr:hypothetical protein RISK_001676 [Rhodopirellula islandica]